MKCHYEVLEIPIDADDSEIKSSYRKLALKWHPDKNLDSPELAKEQFQIVQQAYEVLSDKQERAWYDTHREQILRGRNSQFEDKSLDVFQYFTTTCFKGYGDDDNGFYTIYRHVFKQIAKEDFEFIDEQEKFCEIPNFGKSDSDYEEFRAFYDYWMGYSTKKSYSWLDPYDIREGRGDRRVLKIIEKENKKARLKAKKERNEEVRNLVAFVRKRDKRVQAYKKELDAKTLENRKKQEQLSKRKRLEHKKLYNTEKQADWLKFDNVQSELEEVERYLAQEFGEQLSNSEEEAFNNLYCVACNKMFKTPKSFENHELSKKHRENVEILKESMLEDDVESIKTDDVDEYNEFYNNEENLEEMRNTSEMAGKESVKDEEPLSCHEFTKKKRQKAKNKKTANHQSENENYRSAEDIQKQESKASDKEVDDSLGESEELNRESDNKHEEIINKKISRRNKKAKNALNEEHNHLTDESHNNCGIGELSSDDFDFGTSKNQRKKNKRGTNKYASNTNDEKKGDKEPADNFDADSVEPTLNIDDGRKMKKDIKKEKKGHKNHVKVTAQNEIDTAHCCVTCKGDFPSKNKLFDHLKKTGHGVYIPPKVRQVKRKGSVRD